MKKLPQGFYLSDYPCPLCGAELHSNRREALRRHLFNTVYRKGDPYDLESAYICYSCKRKEGKKVKEKKEPLIYLRYKINGGVCSPAYFEYPCLAKTESEAQDRYNKILSFIEYIESKNGEIL